VTPCEAKVLPGRHEVHATLPGYVIANRQVEVGYDEHQPLALKLQMKPPLVGKIVVTANVQAWRNFIEMRGTIHADAEIRELALALLVQFKAEYPNLFQDFVIGADPTTQTPVAGRIQL
jgi:hypothetical protein